MNRRPDVCLVAPGHLASTPRLVRNADALAAAGYSVHVVSGRHFTPAEPLDATLLAHARWSSTRVDLRGGWRPLWSRIDQKLARFRLSASSDWPLAARAQHSGHAPLVAAAARTGASFYYGHGGVAGLAAAAGAARLNGTNFGFDAEDWHEEESDSPDAAHLTAVRTLLRGLLPRARFLTCASPLIGDAYAQSYGVRLASLLNVFPLADAPAAPRLPRPPSADNPAILYWFSQTIGPGRGLEQIVDTLLHLRTPAVLHLRGFPAAGFIETLRARAGSLANRIVVFPPADAGEMVRLSAGAHLGLSLEQPTPRNRDLCLTNKIFAYLLAGVPVALTPTSAQTQLAPDLGPAALMLNPGAPRENAALLDNWFARHAASAAAHAWKLGRERFNWDRKSEKLVALFGQQIGAPQR